MNRVPVQITINGISYQHTIEPSMTLLHYIREECGLTGTKSGCEDGECGACTVLMDGRPVRSCIILAVEADGTQITTVEGLAKGDELHPLQQSLVDTNAVQCGFCMSGILVAGAALLEETATPTEEQVYERLGGHLCRCAGYNAMSEAVHVAAAAMKHEEENR